MTNKTQNTENQEKVFSFLEGIVDNKKTEQWKCDLLKRLRAPLNSYTETYDSYYGRYDEVPLNQEYEGSLHLDSELLVHILTGGAYTGYNPGEFGTPSKNELCDFGYVSNLTRNHEKVNEFIGTNSNKVKIEVPLDIIKQIKEYAHTRVSNICGKGFSKGIGLVYLNPGFQKDYPQARRAISDLGRYTLLESSLPFYNKEEILNWMVNQEMHKALPYPAMTGDHQDAVDYTLYAAAQVIGHIDELDSKNRELVIGNAVGMLATIGLADCEFKNVINLHRYDSSCSVGQSYSAMRMLKEIAHKSPDKFGYLNKMQCLYDDHYQISLENIMA